jgi:hypothetical protein
MDLVGVEFVNFACFDRCFVPLRSGVTVLVGRNNTGKTAILRGLSALSALPFDQPQPLDGALANYARKGQPHGRFDLRIRFVANGEDVAALGGKLSGWPQVSQAKSRELIFTFAVFAGGNIVGLSQAALVCDGDEFQVMGREKSTLMQIQYDGPPGQISRRTQIPVLTGRQLEADGWPLYAPVGLFSAFAPLRHVCIVDAYRVPHPQTNLQAVENLPRNAATLAPFLDTLHGNNRRKFQEIETLVTRVFPEIEFINPEKRGSSVSLSVTKRGESDAIPLTHCGTGVEQVLALASFVLTAKPGSTILLDEPHSYLHPAAEREVIGFLLAHGEHRYLISTHSAILVNSVPPDRVIALSSPVTERPDQGKSPTVSAILHSLGYRNSDFLFNDRLIFVEGASDQDVLPVFLSHNLAFRNELARTGFPTMDGEGRLRGGKRESSLLHYERLLSQLGRSSLPRVYLFDGDCEQDERNVLRNMPGLSAAAAIGFLPRAEIENYLLVPEAICQALQELAQVEGGERRGVSVEAIQSELTRLLAEPKNYVGGAAGDERTAKGSMILNQLFDAYGFRYQKRATGRLIAEHVTRENQSHLAEVWEAVSGAFG